MKDLYSNFEELAENERKGVDYEIDYVCRDSNVLVMAPHGGKIEYYTSALAVLIANGHFSWYSFKGIKKHGNGALHITSHRFDEPLAIEAAGEAEKILAIHGAKNADASYAMVGGLDVTLVCCLAKGLANAGFETRPPGTGMGAVHPENICNRGKRNKGAQLELSRKLRDELRQNGGKRRRFVLAVRRALND